MEGTNTYMPVMPANYGGMGDIGGGWWLILLFLFLGFGGNGFGFGNNNAAAFAGADVQRGFDQSTIMNGINGIQSTLTNNQTADMNQVFGIQTAVLQGFNGLQGQLSQCCCDNRLATVQTQNIVQSEGAATRGVIQDSVQKVMDKLCTLEIDNLKGQIVNLQSQLTAANLAASQTAQTAQIIAALTPTV